MSMPKYLPPSRRYRMSGTAIRPMPHPTSKTRSPRRSPCAISHRVVVSPTKTKSGTLREPSTRWGSVKIRGGGMSRSRCPRRMPARSARRKARDVNQFEAPSVDIHAVPGAAVPPHHSGNYMDASTIVLSQAKNAGLGNGQGKIRSGDGSKGYRQWTVLKPAASVRDLRRQRLAHFAQELIHLERLEQHRLQPFLAGADDAVVGVVAEAGHEDDGDCLALLPRGGEDVVTRLVGHLDVADHEVEVLLIQMRDRFGAVGARGDLGVVLAENVADRRADVRLVVGQEDLDAAEDRVFFALDVLRAEDRGVRPLRGLAEALSDAADVVENLTQPVAQVVVADVVVHERAGVGSDVVQRASDFGVHVVGDLVTRADALDDHQVEDVQRDRDVAPEDLGELPVVLVKRGALAGFDVEDADHLVMQSQRNGERALGRVEAHHVARVALDVWADVAAARRGDVAADAVAFGVGEEVDVERFVRQPGANHHLQLVALAVEQPDREVIEVHQVAREADDLVFQELEALADVHLRQRVALEADELAASLVDGVDLLLEPPRAGCVPHDGHDLHDVTGRRDHRTGDHLQELLVFDVQRVAFGSVEAGGRVGGL